MTSRNEAAERIPNSEGERLLRGRMQEWEYGQQWLDALDEALAAERRATVERFRKTLHVDQFVDGDPADMQDRIFAAVVKRALDEEAARG